MPSKNTPVQKHSQVSNVNRPVHHFALDKPWARFHEAIQEAAAHGKIANSEPFVRELNSDMRAFQGLAALLKIVENNTHLSDHFDDDDPHSIKPLTNFTISALLGLASEICSLKSEGICRLADWTEERIASQEANHD